ncbi:MAG: hypothetical protein J5971_09275 [Prevotella sp.]|nr:hypothetical protein [Prevotella sp.]
MKNSLQSYKKVCELRAIGALKVTKGGRKAGAFVTFVFFLMGSMTRKTMVSANRPMLIQDVTILKS